MYGKGTLAATGTGLVFFGTQVGFSVVLAVAVGLFLAGALTYRVATRKRKYVS
jgi:hypothetical protein